MLIEQTSHGASSRVPTSEVELLILCRLRNSCAKAAQAVCLSTAPMRHAKSQAFQNEET